MLLTQLTFSMRRLLVEDNLKFMLQWDNALMKRDMNQIHLVDLLLLVRIPVEDLPLMTEDPLLIPEDHPWMMDLDVVILEILVVTLPLLMTDISVVPMMIEVLETLVVILHLLMTDFMTIITIQITLTNLHVVHHVFLQLIADVSTIITLPLIVLI